MTPGTEPALTPDEWLSGVNRGKTMTVPGVSVGLSAWGLQAIVLGGGEPQKRPPLTPPPPPRSHPDVAEGGLQEDVQNRL